MKKIFFLMSVMALCFAIKVNAQTHNVHNINRNFYSGENCFIPFVKMCPSHCPCLLASDDFFNPPKPCIAIIEHSWTKNYGNFSFFMII